MVTFLSRFLIKDYKNTTDTKVRQAYGMLCGAVGIVLNIFLFIGKALAGSISGSIAITADAFNNLSAAGSYGISLVGVKMVILLQLLLYLAPHFLPSLPVCRSTATAVWLWQFLFFWQDLGPQRKP